MNFCDDKHTICTCKDVMQILNISAPTACRYIQKARAALNKPKPQILLVSDFKRFFGLI